MFGGLRLVPSTREATLFGRRLRSNWQSLPLPRRRWWQRQKTTEGCDADPKDTQIRAAYGLLHRRFPSFRHRVQFSRSIDCTSATENCFSVEVEGDVLCVRGTSGVELATGLHWFLKAECSGISTWEKTGGTQFMEGCLSAGHLESLKTSLHMHHDRRVPLSLYQNAVTSSYSTAFWDWKRWEAEIDWMALHGVNLPLALSGQEYVWVKVYQEMGLSFSELEDFFTGPAFLSWGRMGNIQGYAGPLPWSYIRKQAELQKQIVERMRSFGMTPILSGFAGFVPRALLRHFPQVKAKKSSNWCDFDEAYCCVWLLDPHDPLFGRLGAAFVKLQREVYGCDAVGFYAVDVFNEMLPSHSDPQYLRQTSEAVFSSMKGADPSAVWIMQAWLFYSDREFWQAEQIQAVLSEVPMGHLLLLDLYAERYPQWKRTEAFFGHPFIWCSLHNFGGNSEMHGAMPEIAHGLHEALVERTNIVGTGMCPEGLEQNPVVYELASEMPFRGHPPDLERWFQAYAVQRYGGKECPSAGKAWKMLSESVYENTAHRHETVMDVPTSRPGLDASEAVWGLKPQIWYNPNKVIKAWEALLECGEEMAGLSSFRYDLVDVGRQVLSKLATKYWKTIETAYRQRDVKSFQLLGEKLLSLLDDLDDLLGSHAGFLLGPALQEARQTGETEEEERQMEQNLKLQITIWGASPAGDTELSDYANREWADLVRSFYRERWRRWLARCLENLKKRRPYDGAAFVQEMVEFTHQWVAADNLGSFRTVPRGDALSLSKHLLEKYKEEAWVLEMNI